MGFGRTGSHWAADLLSSVTGTQLMFDDEPTYLDTWRCGGPATLHTNRVWDFLISPFVLADAVIIFSMRQNVFDATISQIMAEHSNEWYHYSDRKVDPFYVDPMEFFQRMWMFRQSQKNAMKLLRKDKIPHRVLCYEHLKSAVDRRRFIADLVGYQGEDCNRHFSTMKSTRDPRSTIINYDQLKNKCWRLSNE